MVGDSRWPGAVVTERPGRNVCDLPGTRVPAADVAAKPGPVDDVGIGWIWNIVVALVAANRMPVTPADRPVVAATRDRDGAAVLLAGIDPIREAVVRCEMIELAGRLVVPAAPRAAAVDADRRALVGAFGEVPGILGIDPQPMIVVAPWAAAEYVAFCAAPGAAANRLSCQVDDIRVSRIDRDPVVIIR